MAKFNEEVLNKIGNFIKRVPSLLTSAIFIFVYALCAYWWIMYKGLYRLVAEFQLKLFGAYMQILSGILTILIATFIIIFPVVFLLGLLFRNKNVEKDAKAESVISKLQNIHDTDNIKFKGYAFIIICFIVFIAVGAYFFINLNAADVRGYSSLKSKYVNLRGRLLTGMKLGIKSSKYGITYYIPVVYEREGIRGFSGVFVKMSRSVYLRSLLKSYKTTYIKGTLEKNGLPGLLRTKLERSLPDYANNHWVLSYKNSPSSERTLGIVFLVLASVFGVVILIVFAVGKRRRA
jgi:hypothetical protein